MPLHPEVAEYVSAVRQVPPVHPSTVNPLQRRQSYRELGIALWPQLAPMADVVNLTLPLTASTSARLYVPLQQRVDALLIHFHGGSFVVGDLDSHQGLCRRLAADLGARVLSVEYRLAPECAFPTPLEDCVAAVRYVAEHRSQFGANDAPLIVIGDSAGGNLAACVAAMTREEHLLAAQVLIYPPMGPEVLSKSAHEYATGYMLEMDHLHFDYRQYLASYRNHADPRVSPLLNEDLSGSVPAIVVVAEFDPLRDEGLAYAGLLEHFGTPVEILEGEGMVHGFLQLGGVVPECLSILDDLALHLERFVSA